MRTKRTGIQLNEGVSLFISSFLCASVIVIKYFVIHSNDKTTTDNDQHVKKYEYLRITTTKLFESPDHHRQQRS